MIKCFLLFPQFFISLLLIFILLLAAGILGAIGENKVRQEVSPSSHITCLIFSLS